MKRKLIRLSENVYDVLVIGGGIYGVCVAWDAALRGLSVALVEKGDFGHATSFNTLRLIHGGFRYLQSLNIMRARQSFNEQMIFMKIAPHLVHPLPFFIPAYGHLMRGKEMLSLALHIYNHVVERNPLDGYQRKIPRGRTISREECLQTLPDIEEKGLTGGIILYDCQISDSERLIISIAKSAAESGADLANYLEVIGFIKDQNRLGGVKVKDLLTGDEFEICARFIVNTSGPWIQSVLGLINSQSSEVYHGLSKAFNLVINRKFSNDFAIGVYSQVLNNKTSELLGKRSRYLFITPWRGYSMIGTEHLPSKDDPENLYLTEEEIKNFLEEVNEAYPQASLVLKDVCFKYKGCLPTIMSNKGSVRLATKYRIYNHGREQCLDGLISVSGVKFTEARHVAEKVVDLVFKKMVSTPPALYSDITPVYGGRIERFNEFLIQESRKNPFGLSPSNIQNLISNYGSAYAEVLKYIDKDEKSDLISSSDLIRKAEILYSIRDEMAQKLSVVIFRRTDLGIIGETDSSSIMKYAGIMAKELNWNSDRIKQEMNEVKAVLSSFTLNG